MERLIDAITALVTRDGFKGQTPATPADLRVDLRAAPPAVKRLADALATRYYNVDLGELAMFRNSDGGVVSSLAHLVELACEDGDLDPDWVREHGGPGGGPFDPDRTLLLGEDSGGMSYFGVSWSGGALSMVIVEVEDPVEENLLTHFATPADLLAFVDEQNEDDDEDLPDVDALKNAVGIAVAERSAREPARAYGLRAWDGTPPPHPHARARAHFDRPRMLLEAGPSTAGRYLVARRFAAGSPPVPAAIAVIGPKGTELEQTWPVPRDLYGVCIVPGTERALMCTGAPGPLVELDLVTGEERERLANVRWTCGFLDETHFAVLAADRIQAYRYDADALGAPISTIPMDGFNIFVGHGRVFGKSRDVGPEMIRVIGWNGTELFEETVVPVDKKVFALHAAAEHDGNQLVAAIDTAGGVRWFVYG